MSKEKKSNAKIISLVAAAVIVTVILGVLIYGIQKPTVKVLENSMQIKSMYGLTINFSDIKEITLIENNINGIAYGLKRTNGIGNIGKTLKGNFESNNIGKLLLFVYSGSSPTIRIERKEEKDIYINMKDGEETKKLYEELRLKVIDTLLTITQYSRLAGTNY